MKFEVKDVLVIRSAEIEVGPADKGPGITLIVGHNSSGKTVLRNCLAAALTGEARLYGVTRDDAVKLVREGAEYGLSRVCYSNDEGVRISWSSEGYRVHPKGNPYPVDTISVGWDSALNLSGREWIKWLSRVAGVEVAVTDNLRRACPVKVHADDAIHKIRGLGWDGAAAEYAGEARAERSRWSKICGRPWGANLLGSDNILHWAHEDRDPKLDLAAAQIELAKLKEEAMIAAAQAKAIPPEERARLRAEATTFAKLAEQHAQLVSTVQTIEHEMATGRATYSCPSCNLQVRLHQGKLVPAAKEPPVDVDALLEQRTKTLVEANKIMEQMAKAQEAKLRLEAADASVKSGQTDDLAKMQERIEQLEPKVSAAQITETARTIAAGAIELQRVAEWLGPGGYRRDMLVEAVGGADDPESLQARLEAITRTMFGDCSALIDTDDPDMPVMLGNALEWRTLTWGGDASSSMLRVRAALQILHAERVDAPCVLIDMLDTLQGLVQQAFFKALVQHVKVPVVLFATPAAGVLPETDKLAATGLGRTYVIDPDGVVHLVGKRT